MSYLLSFQGYPPILQAVRLQHRYTGQVEKRGGQSNHGLQVHVQVQYQSEVTNLQRHWCHSQKFKNPNQKRSDRKASKDPLADLPEWLKDFKENLKETELHASAHRSPESDRESYDSGNEMEEAFAHFPRDRDCDVCLRTKITKASCRRRTGEALLRAEKFGDLITADHKVLNEGLFKRRSPVRCRGARSCCSMDGQVDGVPKAFPSLAAADSRGSRTCVCAITLEWGGTCRERRRINVPPWYRLVGVV